MNLELDIINIQDIQFAEKTAISDGVLYVNIEAFAPLMGSGTETRVWFETR